MSEQKPITRLARDWLRAKSQLAHAKGLVISAEAEVRDTANILGRVINPGDQAVGENFTSWVPTGFREEKLISFTLLDDEGDGTYKVKVRHEGLNG